MKTKFVVNDDIMGDSLNAIGTYNSPGAQKLVIYGGVGLQLYARPCFSYLLRPTHDIDVIPDPQLNDEARRNGIKTHLNGQLRQYRPKMGKIPTAYEVELTDSDGDLLFIHFLRSRAHAYEREREHMERRVGDATQLPCPNSDNRVYVVRLEDLAAGKSRRLKMLDSMKKIPDELADLAEKVQKREWDILSSQNLGEWLFSLIRQKNMLPAHFDRGEEIFRRIMGEYMAAKDIYDAALIAKLITGKKAEFDETYYDNIFRKLHPIHSQIQI